MSAHGRFLVARSRLNDGARSERANARRRVDSSPAPTAVQNCFATMKAIGICKIPPRRSDYLDAIKFIPFNTNGDWYLTIGGEIRERYEYYHKQSLGTADRRMTMAIGCSAT